MLTVHEIFDTVATHLFTQGERSVGVHSSESESEICLYRGPNGTKCAVGYLIPNKLYHGKFENLTVSKVLGLSVGLKQLLGNHYLLLAALQTVHDNFTNWRSTEVMRAKLSSIAHIHNLDPSILSTLSFKDR